MGDDRFYKGLIAGLFTGLAAGVIMAGLGSWFWQVYIHKRQFARSSGGKSTALRPGEQPTSDDEVWSQASAR